MSCSSLCGDVCCWEGVNALRLSNSGGGRYLRLGGHR